MRLNELISSFYIWTSIEEKTVLDSINEPRYLSSFTEREQTIIEQLARKSLVTKIGFNDNPLIKPNANEY